VCPQGRSSFYSACFNEKNLLTSNTGWLEEEEGE